MTDSKTDKPDVGGFLSIATIDARIAALQELRESILRAASVGALGSPGDVDPTTFSQTAGTMPRSSDQPIDLPTGAFLNKSMPEAIKLLMFATKRKWTPRDVAATLREGGYESTSRNFENTVTGTMYRMRDQGTLLKFKDGFGLAELYPEHLRAKIAESSKPPAKARARKRAKANGAGKREKPAKPARNMKERVTRKAVNPQKAKSEKKNAPTTVVGSTPPLRAAS